MIYVFGDKIMYKGRQAIFISYCGDFEARIILIDDDATTVVIAEDITKG